MHDMYIVPAYKESTLVSRGRGQGGLVPMWRKPLTKYVSKVPCFNHRLQATKFSFSSSSLLIIEIYLINRIIYSTGLSPYKVHPSPVPTEVHPPGFRALQGGIQ